jgi:hypothetical protein
LLLEKGTAYKNVKNMCVSERHVRSPAPNPMAYKGGKRRRKIVKAI